MNSSAKAAVMALLGIFVLISSLVFWSVIRSPSPSYGVVDKNLQQQMFFKCMESLPAGPQATMYNDWNEVVAECGEQARRLSWGCVSNCTGS